MLTHHTHVHTHTHTHTHTHIYIAHELALEVFQGLTSNTQIVKESIQKGMNYSIGVLRGVIYHTFIVKVL